MFGGSDNPPPEDRSLKEMVEDALWTAQTGQTPNGEPLTNQSGRFVMAVRVGFRAMLAANMAASRAIPGIG